MSAADPDPKTPPRPASGLSEDAQRFAWSPEEFAAMVIPNPDPGRRTFAERDAERDAEAAAKGL